MYAVNVITDTTRRQKGGFDNMECTLSKKTWSVYLQDTFERTLMIAEGPNTSCIDCVK